MNKNGAQALASIFKAYDIRGPVSDMITEHLAQVLGWVFGRKLDDLIVSTCREATGTVATCVVGRDGRLSSGVLSSALVDGLCRSGVNVIDIGLVTTPIVYFAAHFFRALGAIMVTGSHNPPDQNGFKMLLQGQAIYGDEIQCLGEEVALVLKRGFSPLKVSVGQVRMKEVLDQYVNRIVQDIRLDRSVRIVIDCGNGAAGIVAARLFRALGCTVTELFCDVDGTFPNHHPDPARPENLQDLIRCVQQVQAEIGFAFDGDGDRIGVVTPSGRVIEADRLLMLLAGDVLTRNPGAKVVFDVKCSSNTAIEIRKAGGIPIMCRTGHSFIKAKLKESGAVLAGEMSGHIFFQERWYGFDDGLYAGARLLEVLSRCQDIGEKLELLPNLFATPEIFIPIPEGDGPKIIEGLKSSEYFRGLEIVTIDGIRAEFLGGFGLIRSSNTGPYLVARFESDTLYGLRKIGSLFREALKSVMPGITLSF